MMRAFFNILRLSLCAVGTLPLCLMAQVPHSPHFQLQQLADGVYAAIQSRGGGAICNAGIVDLGNETLVFDTFLSPEAAEDLREAAKTLTGHPVKYVVNSHFHNDHIRGNQVFGGGAVIISTEWTRQAIAEQEPQNIKEEKEFAPKRLKELEAQFQNENDPRKRAELHMWIGYYRAMVQSFAHLITVLPAVTFTKELTLHGSAREVRLIAFDRGHTGSDVILYLPQEKIVFTGDLVFIHMHPYVADGFPDHWIDILDTISQLDIQQVVPGHGPVGTAADLETMVRYIQNLTEMVDRQKKLGKPLAELLALPVPPPFDAWHFPFFYQLNLKFLYNRDHE